MSQRRRRQSSLFIKHVQTSTLFLFMILSLADQDRKEEKRELVHRASIIRLTPSVQWNTVVLDWVSHMISVQPLIPICPSGDVSKRTTAALTDTLPWAPVHPFHPSMPLSLQSRIMSLSEIQLRDLGPVVCSAAQISRLFPLLKPPLAPELPGRWKITALSAKCGRCFSRISWQRE